MKRVREAKISQSVFPGGAGAFAGHCTRAGDRLGPAPAASTGSGGSCPSRENSETIRSAQCEGTAAVNAAAHQHWLSSGRR